MIFNMGNMKFKSAICQLFILLPLALSAGHANAADVVRGGKLYAKHCVTCHGVDGVNVMPDAPNFARSQSLLRPDVFILATIKEGKNAMPSFQGTLKDQDILDVIGYLRTLEQFGPTMP